jgi:hypothetical protein
MKLLALLVSTLVIALAAAACGGGDDGYKAAAPAATKAPAATTVPTVAPTPALASLASGVLSGAPGGSAQPRTNGVVASVTGTEVKLQDGTSFMLAPNARFTKLMPIKASDLAPGQFVAITSKRQPDNTLLASVVSIFPESVKIPGGERPLPEGNLMTNATIDTVTGNSFTVTFTGGGSRITLAPDAVLVRQLEATASDLVAGKQINAGVNNGTAASIYLQP